LLTDPQALPGSTSTALNRLGITTTYVVGGSGAVGDVVLAALPGATRLGGADRYATAAAIATAVRTQVWAAAGPGSTPSVVVAGGSATSMVDALAAGSLGQLTLLTGYSELTPATAAWLRANPTPQVAVVGGPGSIGPSVLVALGSRGHPTG
ncbi:MAG: cell wall-binding repeat-containing protein, partial [Actinomycetes bacterium]